MVHVRGFIISVLLLFSTSLIAHSHSSVPHHFGGWRFGVEGGYGFLNTNEAGESSSTSSSSYNYSHDDRVYGFHGGYEWPLFSRFVSGVEVGYRDLGETKQTNTGTGYKQTYKTSDILTLNALLTGRYFITQGLHLFGKAGFAYQKLKRERSEAYSNADDNVSFSEQRENINPEFVLGLGYKFNSGVGINLAYNTILGGGDPYNPSSNHILLGLDYDLNSMTLPPIYYRCGYPGGWRAGINLGYGLIQTDEYGNSRSSESSKFDFSNGGSVYGVNLGYEWPLSDRLLVGAEVGYRYLGKTRFLDRRENYRDYQDREESEHTLNVLLTGRYFIHQGLNLFAKIGAAYRSMTREMSFFYKDYPDESYKGSEHRDHLMPETVLGIGYEFRNGVGLGLSYDAIWGGKYNESAPFYSGVLLDITYSLHNLVLPKTLSLPPVKGGWRLGADVGYVLFSTLERGEADQGRSYSNADGAGYSLYLGYEWPLFQRFLSGVEVGYRFLGETESKAENLPSYRYLYKIEDVRIANALLTGRYFINRHLNLFGKFGLAYQMLKRDKIYTNFSSPENSYSISGRRSNIVPEIVLGMGYQFNNGVGINFSYDAIIGNYNSNTPFVGSVLLGLSYDLNMLSFAKNTAVFSQKSGWRVGVDLGYGMLSTDEAGYESSTPGTIRYTYQNSEAVYGVHGGYEWLLSQRFLFGLEAGYRSLGETTETVDYPGRYRDPYHAIYKNKEVQMLDLLLTGRYFIEKGLNIFGKVGFAYQALTREKIYTSYSDSTQNYKASEKRENINPEVVVGMGYQFSKGVGLSLAYNTIISTSNSTYLKYNPSFNGVLLSLEYKLG